MIKIPMAKAHYTVVASTTNTDPGAKKFYTIALIKHYEGNPEPVFAVEQAGAEIIDKVENVSMDDRYFDIKTRFEARARELEASEN